MKVLSCISRYRKAWNYAKLVVSLEENFTTPKGNENCNPDLLIHLTTNLHKLEQRLSRLTKYIEQTLTSSLKAQINTADKGYERLALLLRENGERSSHSQRASEQGLQSIGAAINAIRDYTIEKNAELRRYKDGYDYTLLRNFSIRMIQAIEEIEEQLEMAVKEGCEAELQTKLRHACEGVIMALDSQGIERFEPEIGAELDLNSGKMEPIGKQITDLDANHNKICKVVRAGYRLFQESGEHKIIQPAHVVIMYKD